MRARARTQSSIAVSADGEHWLLVNASPDLRAQFTANPALWPAAGVRHTPLTAVLLTDAQIDHVAGLMMLREGCPIPLYCTPSVHQTLTAELPLLSVLSHWAGGVEHHALPEQSGESFVVPSMMPLQFEAIPLSSNAPPYSSRRDDPRPGDNIGLLIHDPRTGGRLFYAPGLGVVDDAVWEAMQASDCVLVDGTCWTDDELDAAGAGSKTARAMGHLPLSGNGGMLSVLGDLGDRRRILVHINNTNPILDEDSTAAAELARAGVEMAWDGMEIEL